MSRIHPSAIIGEQVQLGEDVEIGANCLLAGAVVLGAGVRLLSNVVITGDCKIGAGCEVHPFAVIGGAPQDVKYRGEPTSVVIGERTILREHVTISRGTVQGQGKTIIGADCMFMAGSHVGHDCILGDHVMFGNNAIMAGHCRIGHHAFISGNTACQQRTHIGEYAYIGGSSGINGDMPPFLTAFGVPAELAGVNIIGLKRNGVGREALNELRQLFRDIFHNRTSFAAGLTEAADVARSPEAVRLVAFLTERRAAGHAPLKPRHAS